jgi:hypothetical protein
MGSKRLDDIAALARYNLDLQVKCRCGHTAVLNSDKVLKDCLGSMRDRSLVAIQHRLRCTACKGREVTCGPCFRGAG